ncbi:hypothetical protein [Nostoc sp.]|uniref:hypothetical protein n=1 Tax=Nostoc sp. TaxID=1180 RepID=UPI002FF5C47B
MGLIKELGDAINRVCAGMKSEELKLITLPILDFGRTFGALPAQLGFWIKKFKI